ncbi:patatin-like phospholipase family protein [Trichocoleus sp. DQ-U1]|uniref:patatin-like phospholipase family protein n=1 Tax=Trichocoleus sp. DQ-U1 TaxID=2933926 RepID=UPI003299C7AB
MKANKPFRILALDGGGIRGLVSAILLECLEKKLQELEPKPEVRLGDYFDAIAGTSTGSIIACGVANRISASEIKDLYLNRGIEIFPKFWNVIRGMIGRITNGFSQPIYDGIGLETVLQDVFRNQFGEQLLFEDLPKPTIITSYDTYARQAVVFKNTEPLLGKIPVWEICRSSAAAPVAFPAYEMKNEHFLEYYKAKGYEIPQAGGIPLIDGGVVANAPALCAIAERLHWNLYPPTNPKKWITEGYEWVEIKDIVVASFGTGQPIARGIGIEQARGWGAAEWASPFKGIPIIDILFDGSTDATDYIAQQILWKENYFRFQPLLDKASSIPAFNANPGKLYALKNRVEVYCKEVDEQLNNLAKILTSETSNQAVVGEENVTPLSVYSC